MKQEIEIQVWVKSHGMLYNAYGLDIDHDMHPYNQALAQGVEPEDFGLEHPHTEEFVGKNRSQLIAEIVQLRKELNAMQRYL